MEIANGGIAIYEEYRIVAASDDRTSVVEIQVRGIHAGAEWRCVGIGTARRMKGDKRNPELGHLLAFNRACQAAVEAGCAQLAANGYGPNGETITEAEARNGIA